MSSSADLFRLALNALTRRRLRAYLTILGIFIGIASIVSLISLGQGLKAAVADSFSGFGPDLLFIRAKSAGFGPPGTGAVADLTEDDIRAVQTVPGVEVAARRTIKTAHIELRKNADVTFASNLPDDPARRDLILGVLKAVPETGRIVSPHDASRITIGPGYATPDNPLGRALRVGDKVTIDERSFEVVGILKKTGQPFGERLILMNDDDFDALFDAKAEVGGIAVRVAKGADPSLVAEAITRALRNERNLKNGKEDFTIQTPGQVLSTLNTVLLIVQAVLVGIAAISLLVGGIGVMNTMYTAVLERTREIGVMKSIGAQNRDVFVLFFFESGLLGLVGGTIGLILGIALSKSVEVIGT
ncbi:MAG: ABC transporter permease, partial [Nanoarchaeota archaeon]